MNMIDQIMHDTALLESVTEKSYRNVTGFLKIVHLGQIAGNIKVLGWTVESLADSVVKDDLIVDGQIVAQIIRDFIKTCSIKPTGVIVSLPCSAARLKPTILQAQSDQQLSKQLEEQIARYTFFGGREVVFDKCSCEYTGQSHNEKALLVAVTTREISDAWLAVAKKAGLKLVAIEPAVMPIIRLMYEKMFSDSDSAGILLTLDSNSGSLSVFEGTLPKLCHNLSIGVDDILKGDGIERLLEEVVPVVRYAGTFNETKQFKLNIVASCDYPEYDTIITQIRQSLSSVKVEQINQLLFAEQLGLQDTDLEIVPIFSFCSALAHFYTGQFQERLNLVSQESLTRQETQVQLSLTAKAIIAVILLSIAALILVRMKIKSVEAASAEVETRIIQAAPINEAV